VLTEPHLHWSRRLPRLVEAFAALPADSCVIDGELIADEGDRIGNVFSINRAIGDGRHHHIGVVTFDLLIDDGEDVRGRPLIDRKLRLDGLVARATIPSLSYAAHHLDWARLFTTMDALGPKVSCQSARLRLTAPAGEASG